MIFRSVTSMEHHCASLGFMIMADVLSLDELVYSIPEEDLEQAKGYAGGWTFASIQAKALHSLLQQIINDFLSANVADMVASDGFRIPQRVGANLWVGANILFDHFCPNTARKRINCDPEGGSGTFSRPLDPPLVGMTFLKAEIWSCQNLKEISSIFYGLSHLLNNSLNDIL